MKAIVSLSGGLDSCVLLSEVIQSTKLIKAIGFIYKSKHNKYEVKAAYKIAEHFKIPIEFIDITNAFIGISSGSALLDNDQPIPEGHYEAENMKSTVVPGRNLVFASVLASYAEGNGYDFVMLGAHAGDHHIYPDCRPEFIKHLRATVTQSTDGTVFLTAPFLLNNKTEIVRIGIKNDAPFHLTRTCYKDQEIACGKCGSCTERLEAFANNEAIDPIEYEEK